MYTVIVFENAKEFFDACVKHRAKGDKSLYVPHDIYVVFDGDSSPRFSGGEDAKRFDFGPEVTQEMLIKEAFERAGSSLHLT